MISLEITLKQWDGEPAKTLLPNSEYEGVWQKAVGYGHSARRQNKLKDMHYTNIARFE